MYRVVEIFDSIQSEGSHSGKPATFIRFYGCNLQCVFSETSKCDEPLHIMKTAITKWSTLAILDRLKGKAKLVVITGGEPSLQDINPLILGLQMAGKYVAVETNGSNLENIKEADWITFSPKHMFDGSARKMSSGFHELKLLANKDNPPNEKEWATIKNKYIQPIAFGEQLDMDAMKWCHDYVTKNTQWKLSLQYHKFIGAE